MQQKESKTHTTEAAKKTTGQPKLNENAGYCFSSSLKITDPKTGEVLVKMRCD